MTRLDPKPMRLQPSFYEMFSGDVAGLVFVQADQVRTLPVGSFGCGGDQQSEEMRAMIGPG